METTKDIYEVSKLSGLSSFVEFDIVMSKSMTRQLIHVDEYFLRLRHVWKSQNTQIATDRRIWRSRYRQIARDRDPLLALTDRLPEPRPRAAAAAMRPAQGLKAPWHRTNQRMPY